MKDKAQTVTTQKQLHHQQTTSEREEEAMMKEAEKEIDVVADPIENLKLRCLSRGETGILDFGRAMRHQDYANNHMLSYDEFVSAMEKSRLGLVDGMALDLFKALDVKKCGRIDVHDLILAARAHLSPSRLKVVREAFNKLDRKGDGVITADDIRAGFSVETHPRYLVGDESKEEIVDKFLDNFQNAERTWDGKLTEEEFINYYAGVSPTMEEEGYFDLMIRQAFKLDHATECLYHETASARREEGLMNASLTEVDGPRDPMAKLRFHCLSKGVSGILHLGRMFRRTVDDPSRKLGLEEFSECLSKAVSDLGSEEIRELFDHVKDEEGLVVIAEFLAALGPPLSEERRHMIAAAFKKLDRSGDGVVSADDFKKGYCVARHPRYVVGDESKEEIVDKMLARFESPGWDGKVSEEDFLNFYAVESATIDDDGYFDLMMRQSFKL